MLVRAPYTISFVLAVCCWFRHNAAIPLASHSPVRNKMQDAFKEKKAASHNNWDDTQYYETSKELSDGAFDSDSIETIQNMINNQNMNKNLNILGRGIRRRNARLREDRLRSKYRGRSTKETSTPVTTYKTLEEITKKEQSTNCASGKKKNQRYSSSFVGNVTSHSLRVDKELNEVVGNNSKAKMTSSVHEDEDITLCWIETTTIKENKTVRPPKRLVIREYTISFENSATIPDRYLECKRLEGELMANDPEIGKTDLFEVIDEDTRVSRVVNFTSISHVGDIVVWQHKMVKCGVGPVVRKNIIEWNDGSENPKKRVEIKVSPKMHQLTATKNGEEEPCTEGPENVEIERGSTNVEYITTESCEEDGTCEMTTTSVDISTEPYYQVGITTEGMIAKLPSGESESEESFNLATGFKKPESRLSSEATFVESTVVPDTSTTIRENMETSRCKEDSSDLACLIQKDASSSSKEFPTELSTILTPNSEEKEVITEKESSHEKGPSVTTESSSKSLEEAETISDLINEKTTLFIPTTDTLIESSEVRTVKRTDEGSVTDSEDVENGAITTLQTKITTSLSATVGKKQEESSTQEEGSGRDNSVELTSEELNNVDRIPPSSASTMISGEIDGEQDVTTTTSQFGITEFAGGSGKSGQVLDKLSETSVSAESTDKSITTFEGTSSGESGESAPSGIEETTSVGLKTTSLPRIEPTDLSPTTSGEIDYSCEGSEDCIYVGGSEACDESGNCGRTTIKFCESEECSEEEVIVDQSTSDTAPPAITTEIRPFEKPLTIDGQPPTAWEAENTSTAINNVPITMDTGRSTTTSTPRHKLTLKIKVLLEHVDEKKERHNLVEVEKHLSLDENPEHSEHPALLEQLKSLNDSVNMETVNALLNCTSLSSLTRDSNIIGLQPNDIDDSRERLEFINSGYEDSISEQSTFGHVDDGSNENFQYSDYDQEHEATIQRRRRRSIDNETEDSEIIGSSTSFNFLSTSEPQDVNLTTENVQPSTTINNFEEVTTSNATYAENENNTTTEKDEITSTIPSVKESVDNETKMEVVRQTLPGIQEDVIIGLQHVASQLAQNNLTISNITEIARKHLLDIVTDPKNGRIRSRRRRAAAEEVGHWSNERIGKAPMGGSLRSFTEFTLYKVLP